MMTAIVFNGTKIYMDTDMELHVIRGDLHIDTKAFKPVPKARSATKRTASGGTSKRGYLQEFILKKKPKVGGSIEFPEGTINDSIRRAYHRLDMGVSIAASGQGTWIATRTS